jgi:hypothetical protein
MNLKWYYWYFQSAIPERICDDMVRYGKEQDKQMVGILNGIGLRPVSLQNIKKVNFMIGIVIRILNHIINQKTQIHMVS